MSTWAAKHGKALTLDLEDTAAREFAVRRLFTTLVDLCGREEADRIWRSYRDLNVERERAYFQEDIKLGNALYKLSEEERFLVLRYFAMPKPSKRGLATEILAENKKGKYETILQQIRRPFRENREACRIIGEAPLALRQGAFEHNELWRKTAAEMRAEGILPRSTKGLHRKFLKLRRKPAK